MEQPDGSMTMPANEEWQLLPPAACASVRAGHGAFELAGTRFQLVAANMFPEVDGYLGPYGHELFMRQGPPPLVIELQAHMRENGSIRFQGYDLHGGVPWSKTFKPNRMVTVGRIRHSMCRMINRRHNQLISIVGKHARLLMNEELLWNADKLASVMPVRARAKCDPRVTHLFSMLREC